jgi:hypothetical protein
MRTASRWLLAALGVAWIVTILPALPLPDCRGMPRLFGGSPDARDIYIALGGRVLLPAAFLAGLAWGPPGNAFDAATRGSTGTSPAADAALHAVVAWAVPLAEVLAAIVPLWVLWALGSLRFGGRRRRPTHRLLLGGAVGSAFDAARTHPARYGLLAALVAVSIGTGRVVTWASAGAAWPPWMLGQLVDRVVGAVAGILGYRIGRAMLDEGSPCEVGGVARVVRFAVISLVVGVVGVAGLICFVVPGVLWLATFGFATAAVALEDVGLEAALGRSAELVRGARRKLILAGALWFFFVLVPTSIVISSLHAWLAPAVQATIVLLDPLLTLCLVACYLQLAAQSPPGPQPRRPVDPSLVLAVVWSVALLGTFAATTARGPLGPAPACRSAPCPPSTCCPPACV